MKVAVSATGASPNSTIHRQFGRCEWFLLFDDSNKEVEAVENTYAEVQAGAGIGCAQDLIEKGVEAVISTQGGPKAFEVLSQAGVGIYLAPPDISAQEAFKRFRSKKLTKMEIRTF